MVGRCACLLFLVCLATAGYGQNEDLMKQDSAKRDTSKLKPTVSDSLMIDSSQPIQKIKSYADRFDPRKALLYAAIFPGSGQFYNKKYWKIPLIYGGFGILIYTVYYYQTQYILYKDQLFFTINYPTRTLYSGLTQDQLRTVVDLARRQRDYFLIINFFWYILQMVDAHVDAHLKEFDLNPKLQVRIEPASTGSGLGLVFRF